MAPATPAATIHSTTATQPPSWPLVTKMTNPAPPSSATRTPAKGPARTPARTETRSPRPLGTPRYALSDAPANAMATATCTAPPSSRAAKKDTGRPLGRREDRMCGPTVRAAFPGGRALDAAPGSGESAARGGRVFPDVTRQAATHWDWNASGDGAARSAPLRPTAV